MREFKVGDRVVSIVKEKYCYGGNDGEVPAGSLGTVVVTVPRRFAEGQPVKQCIEVSLDDKMLGLEGGKWNFSEHELNLVPDSLHCKDPKVKFKIGDHVKVINKGNFEYGNHYSIWICGPDEIDTGVIVEIDSRVRVQHDKDPHRRWVFNESELALIAPAHPDAIEGYLILHEGDIRYPSYEWKLKDEPHWKAGDGCPNSKIDKHDSTVKDYRILIKLLPKEAQLTIAQSDIFLKRLEFASYGQSIEYPSSITIKLSKEVPMIVAPATELEKNACEVAKQEAVAAAIATKKQIYKEAMQSYISVQSQIKTYQDQLAKLITQTTEMETNLGITAEQKALLF